MTELIKCIEVKIGYVESGQLSGLLFIHEIGFTSANYAVASLADALYSCYKDELSPMARANRRTAKCCKKASKEQHNYCPQCGSHLAQTFDLIRYVDWLRRLPIGTADSLGGAALWSRDNEWNPWVSLSDVMCLSPKQVFVIGECGEVLLAKAVANQLRKDFPKQDWDSELDELGYLPEEYKRLLPCEERR